MNVNARMYTLLEPHQLQLKMYKDLMTKTQCYHKSLLTHAMVDEANLKAHFMQLYPDLFDGVWTIKHAVVHLDVKPGAIPIVYSPRRVPDALRDSLKEDLDRMESMKVIRKLDINEASDWVHALVLVVKPNSKLCVCLDPHTLNSVL